jgi:hypothetical protein
MKRFVVLLLIALMALSVAPAGLAAKTGAAATDEPEVTKPTKVEVGKKVDIPDTLEFTVGEPQTSDTLGAFGEKSGDKYDFLVIPITMLNTSFDSINIDEVVQVSLKFRNKYIFAPYEGELIDDSFLLGKWIGDYNNGQTRCVLTITKVEKDGLFDGVFDFQVSSSVSLNGRYTIRGRYSPEMNLLEFEGVEWVDNPASQGSFLPKATLTLAEGAFEGKTTGDFPMKVYRETKEPQEPRESQGQGEVLDMLLEDTVHYVFKVPKIVTSKDNGEVTLSLAIAGVEYALDVQVTE